MESQRQLKFARLIQKELSEIFQRDMSHQLEGAFVSITHVKVSPDLGVASAYLSFINTKRPQALLEQIEDLNKTLRMNLSRRIGKQVRIIPELRFFLDDSAAEAERIDKLLSGLNIPKE